MVSTLNIPLLPTRVCDVPWLLGSSFQNVLTDLQPPPGQRLRMPADSLWGPLLLVTKPVQGERVCFSPQFRVHCGGEVKAAGAWSSWRCYISSQEESNECMAAAQPPLLYTSQESSQGIGATHNEQVFLPWWKQPRYPFLSGMQLRYTHHSCNTSARVGTLTWQIGVTVWRVHHKVRPPTSFFPPAACAAPSFTRKGDTISCSLYFFFTESKLTPPPTSDPDSSCPFLI